MASAHHDEDERREQVEGSCLTQSEDIWGGFHRMNDLNTFPLRYMLGLSDFVDEPIWQPVGARREIG